MTPGPKTWFSKKNKIYLIADDTKKKTINKRKINSLQSNQREKEEKIILGKVLPSFVAFLVSAALKNTHKKNLNWSVNYTSRLNL